MYKRQPSICIIDSGIQESHRLLSPFIFSDTSHCFLPGEESVADEVANGGHGTRVAGAAIYPEEIPKDGEFSAPFWIENARVLNGNCKIPPRVLPATLMAAVIKRFHINGRKTKIFNHSINAVSPCRLKHMSSWAAAIDALSFENDILVVQSAGNIKLGTGLQNLLGIQEHLAAGRLYPEFLVEASSRVANPGQSLQALTVGSVTYGQFVGDVRCSMSKLPSEPSPFSLSLIHI